ERVSTEDECLIVAGNPMDNSDIATIRALAADQQNVVTDFRYIPNEEVPIYFAACDFGVFPYRDIFSSGSVVLSLSFGCPVIAPNAGCIPSILPDGNVIYDSLSNGFERARDLSLKERTELGETNHVAAVTNHDWDDIAERFETVYRS
ncbi:glycosyltransferase, partial [Haloferax profundi]|uniref:glycosyltransferase n=1 Tax=Haloferax profundi TaxID=1544718 RepID=UPI000B158B00